MSVDYILKKSKVKKYVTVIYVIVLLVSYLVVLNISIKFLTYIKVYITLV